MAPIVNSIEIDRPPVEVFAVVADPARFPEWQPDVLRVVVEGDGPPREGTRFTTVRRVGGVEREMTQVVAVREEPRRWAVRALDGAIRPNGDVTVEPLDGGTRSRVTFSLDVESRGAGDLLAPLVRKLIQKRSPHSYRNLKRLLEERAPIG